MSSASSFPIWLRASDLVARLSRSRRAPTLSDWTRCCNPLPARASHSLHAINSATASHKVLWPESPVFALNWFSSSGELTSRVMASTMVGWGLPSCVHSWKMVLLSGARLQLMLCILLSLGTRLGGCTELCLFFLPCFPMSFLVILATDGR